MRKITGNGGRLGKKLLAAALVLGMMVPAINSYGTRIVQGEETAGAAGAEEATGGAVSVERIEDRAIASYHFDSAEEVKNMNNPKYNLSEVREVTGCGSVLVMGERQRKNAFGVEMANPYAGKEEEYVETLADALANNGVTYNGTIADETRRRETAEGSGVYYNSLDETLMPLEGRTYPWPKWKKGFTVSVWTRVPENATEDTALFMFRKKHALGGYGGLIVRLNGAAMFFGGDGSSTLDACRNSYHFNYNLEGKDPLAMAGKWVMVTLTIENDQLELYYNGVKAQGVVDKDHRSGTTLTKKFNKGFGYRNPQFILENPAEAYKNFYDLIRNFTEEERIAGDFSDYNKYTFANSEQESIIELLTDEDTEFYLGGDNNSAMWQLGAYTDAAVGIMFDDLNFFDVVLGEQEIAALYEQSESRSDTLQGKPLASDHPAPASAEPFNSSEPSKAPEESESPEPSKAPEESESPEPSKEPEASGTSNPSEEPDISALPKPSTAPEASASAVPSAMPEPALRKGDVNGDQKVDLTDAQLVLKAALKISVLDEQQKEAADADGNGTIDLTDAQMVLKAALKIIDLH